MLELRINMCYAGGEGRGGGAGIWYYRVIIGVWNIEEDALRSGKST